MISVMNLLEDKVQTFNNYVTNLMVCIPLHWVLWSGGVFAYLLRSPGLPTSSTNTFVTMTQISVGMATGVENLHLTIFSVGKKVLF